MSNNTYAIVTDGEQIVEQFRTKAELARWLASYDSETSRVVFEPYDGDDDDLRGQYYPTLVFRHARGWESGRWIGRMTRETDAAAEDALYAEWLDAIDNPDMLIGDNKHIYYSREDVLAGIDAEVDPDFYAAQLRLADEAWPMSNNTYAIVTDGEQIVEQFRTKADAAAENLQDCEIFYLIETESAAPDDLRTGIETRRIEISDEPGRTNVSHEPRPIGWLGTTNDVTAHGVFAGSWAECMEYLEEEGWIPVTESARLDAFEREDIYDDDGDCRVYVPAGCRLVEIANVFGHSALDDWLYDCRSKIAARLAAGEDPEEIEEELVRDAEREGYRLVGVDRWIDSVADDNPTA